MKSSLVHRILRNLPILDEKCSFFPFKFITLFIANPHVQIFVDYIPQNQPAIAVFTVKSAYE